MEGTTDPLVGGTVATPEVEDIVDAALPAALTVDDEEEEEFPPVEEEASPSSLVLLYNVQTQGLCNAGPSAGTSEPLPPPPSSMDTPLLCPPPPMTFLLLFRNKSFVFLRFFDASIEDFVLWPPGTCSASHLLFSDEWQSCSPFETSPSDLFIIVPGTCKSFLVLRLEVVVVVVAVLVAVRSLDNFPPIHFITTCDLQMVNVYQLSHVNPQLTNIPGKYNT